MKIQTRSVVIGATNLYKSKRNIINVNKDNTNTNSKSNKTQQHHNELSNITNIISDIIDSRDKKKSTTCSDTSQIQFHCIRLDGSCILLRNKLLNMYCKQILFLCIDLDNNIEIHSFPKSNYLCVENANKDLTKILNSSHNINTITVGHQFCSKSKVIEDSLVKLFIETPIISVNKNEIEFIVSTVEKMLLDSKHINRKTLKMTIQLTTSYNIELSEIELYIARIINVLELDLSQIENTMLIFNFLENLDINKYRYKLIEKFTSTHLAVTFDRIGECSIIISNKNCKIHGYCNWEKTQLEYFTFDNDNNII